MVSREDKYKSKAFTDTFVYRGGDVLGAWTEGLLGRLGMALVGLASVAVPLAVGWAVLGLWLGTLAGSPGRRRGGAGSRRGPAADRNPGARVVYLMAGPMCDVDCSFSLQMNSNSSVFSCRRALVVTVHGFV